MLHYFFIASFSWMCIEAVHLFTKIVSVFNVQVRRLRYYVAVGWGRCFHTETDYIIIVIIISIVVIVIIHNYYQIGWIKNAASLMATISSSETFAKRRAILLSVRKTVNSQGYSELPDAIKTRENCYPLIW